MVLKIAEVLGTDANSLIYGPLVPESRKKERKRLWTMGSLCVLLCMVYGLARCFAKTGDIYSWSHPVTICRLIVLPAVFALLEWIIFQILGIFCGLKPMKSPSRKIGRSIVWCAAGALGIYLVPEAVFILIAWIRSLQADSLEMSFSLGAVYNSISFYVTLVSLRFPFVYSVLGGLFWLVWIPCSGNPGTDEK